MMLKILLGYCIVNPSNAEATFVQKHNDKNISENHLNPVMLVFIG